MHLFGNALKNSLALLVMMLAQLGSVVLLGVWQPDELFYLGPVIPLTSLLSSFVSGFAIFCAVEVGCLMGKGNSQGARDCLALGLITVTLMTVGLVMLAIVVSQGIVFLSPGNGFQLSGQYLLLWLPGLLPLSVSSVLSQSVRSSGYINHYLCLMVIAAAAVFFFDLLAVVWLKMGLIGTAGSFLLSSTLSLIISMLFCRKLRLWPQRWPLPGQWWKLTRAQSRRAAAVMANSVQPTLLKLVLVSLLTMVSPFWGSCAGIWTRVEVILLVPVNGLCGGMMSCLPKAYGAGRVELVNGMIVRGLCYVLLIEGGLTGLGYWYADSLLPYVTDDQGVRIVLGEITERLSWSYPLLALSIMASQILQVLGRGSAVLRLTVFRNLVLVAAFLMVLWRVGPAEAISVQAAVNAGFAVVIVLTLRRVQTRYLIPANL